MPLERVFPRKSLFAIITSKGLDSQVYPLMPLQVMIPVECLLAFIAFEWPLRLRRWTARMVDVEGMRVVRRQARMMAVVRKPRHAADHGQGSTRMVHIAQNWALTI